MKKISLNLFALALSTCVVLSCSNNELETNGAEISNPVIEFDYTQLPQTMAPLSYNNIGAIHNECMDSIEESNITESQLGEYIWGFIQRRGIMHNIPTDSALFNQIYPDIRLMRQNIENGTNLNINLPRYFPEYLDSITATVCSYQIDNERVRSEILQMAMNVLNNNRMDEATKYGLLCTMAIANASYAHMTENIEAPLPPIDGGTIAASKSFWKSFFEGVQKDFWGAASSVATGLITGQYAAAAATGAGLGAIVAKDALVGGIIGSATPTLH